MSKESKLLLEPKSFPVQIDQCPPGPFVFGEYLYFKTSSGKIYQENGQALPGEFADLLVSPVRAEWVETKKEDCPDMCPRKDEPTREVEVFKPASVGQVCPTCNSPAYACMCHRMDGETDAELKKRRETHVQVKPIILDEIGDEPWTAEKSKEVAEYFVHRDSPFNPDKK